MSADKYGSQTFLTKTVPLSSGDNTVYVFEMLDDDITATYTVTIRRRPIYTVIFDENGGTDVESQNVEEDFLATEPIADPTRAGYTFTGWNYDFTQPIMQDTVISAQWTAHTDTAYTVNYYLQNLDDDEYTLQETLELTGMTDTLATAEIKSYEHFTYNENESNVSGNIDGDGSRVLNVYYTRNVYTISINNSAAGEITNSGRYKYDKEITATVTPNDLAYDFLGWYSGEELLSTDTTYTFTVEKDVTATFALKEGLEKFNFTSTATTIEITGAKDESATEIVIPDCVTRIGDTAFYDCDSLTEIVIPDSVTSIGNKAFSNCNNLTSVTFGENSQLTSVGKDVFDGCENLTYTVKDNLKYLGTENNPYFYLAGTTAVNNYIIDANCKIIGGSAFYSCDSFSRMTIPDGVTTIGDYAFSNCADLCDIVIPDSVTHIGNYAFEGSWLESITFGENSRLTSIGNGAFMCPRLTEIVIPASVTSIGYEAFLGSWDITIYCKAESQPSGWSSSWNNYNSPVYWYSENEPVTEGKYWHYNDNGEIEIWE